MKSLISEEHNRVNRREIAEETDSYRILLSNVRSNEVQFIPLTSASTRDSNIRKLKAPYCTSSAEIYSEYISSSFEEIEGSHRNLSSILTDLNWIAKKERAIDETRGRMRDCARGNNTESYTEQNQFLNHIKIGRSICLIPALFDKEIIPCSTSRRFKNFNSSSFIFNLKKKSDNPSLPYSLQGRTEIRQRRSKNRQNQDFSCDNNYRKKNLAKNDEVNKHYFEPENIIRNSLKRVEKSSERIIRSITIRSIDSVKQIGTAHPNLIIQVFEKYLSDVLDCRAKLLLGRKNLSIFNYEDYLKESSTKLQDLNLTYYMSVQNPTSCLIYPSLLENSVNDTTKCGVKQNVNNKFQLNHKKMNSCCHCKSAKSQQSTEPKRKCSCVKGDCPKGTKLIQPLKTLDESVDTKMSRGCACSQPISAPKSIEQTADFKDNDKLNPKASSLVSGNDMKPKKKCDCGKKNPTGDGVIKTCRCANKSKRKRRSRSRSRDKSHGTKVKSKKHKCDCTESCQPATTVTAKGDDLVEGNICACGPSGALCPCPCRELVKLKTEKDGYISADAYGKKENKRMCVCQPNSNIMRNLSKGEQVTRMPPCGPCNQSKSNIAHKCDICKMVDQLGQVEPDENMSMATFDSSDLEEIASILRDTRDQIINQPNSDKQLISNIRCYKNNSGIVCQSELVECSRSVQGGKSKTNTIEIRIKYPNKKKVDEKECCPTFSSKADTTYCELVQNLAHPIPACCSTKSDLSMLLDSLMQETCGKKSETKEKCAAFERMGNTNSCQSCYNDVTNYEMKDVQCIYKRNENLSCPKLKSSESFDAWALDLDQEEIQVGSCSKESCMRMVDRPPNVRKKCKPEVECDVRSSCMRQKILEKLYTKTPGSDVKIEASKMKTVTQKNAKGKTEKESSSKTKTDRAKTPPKNKVGSKPSKNVTICQKKPAGRSTMQLDQFDQNILSHALDNFFHSKRSI